MASPAFAARIGTLLGVLALVSAGSGPQHDHTTVVTLHPGEPPQILRQLLHLFEAPNRLGLPAFYTLHVWAWKENPTGTFVNWHTNVSCDSFGGQ
jgi:hypothetical protein